MDAGESCDGFDDATGHACPAGCRRMSLGTDGLVLATRIFSRAGGFEQHFGEALVVVGDALVIGTPSEGADAVQIVDARTGELRRVLSAPGSEESGKFEFFGSVLARAGDAVLVGAPFGTDGTAFLFDVGSGALLQTFTSPTPASSAGFGSGLAALGGEVVIGGFDDALHVFDAASGRLVRTLILPTKPSFGGWTLATAGRVVAAGGDGVVYLLDGETGALLATVHGDDVAFGRSLVPTAGGILVGDGSEIWLLEPGTGAVLRKYPRGFDRPLAAANGTVLVRGPGCGRRSEDVPAAYLLDETTGAPRAVLCAPDKSVDYPFVYAATGALVGDRVVVADPDEDTDTVYVFAPCSDGVLVPGEECDDGNVVDGDGCDHNCTLTRCENGIRTPGESCRDDALPSVFDVPGLVPFPCADVGVPESFRLGFQQAWDLARRAVTADRRAASHLLSKASRVLGKAGVRAARAGRTGAVEAACADALAAQLHDARVRASRFRRTHT